MCGTITKALRWIEITPSCVEGRGWSESVHPFGRLPTHARGRVPDDLWNMAESTTGMCFYFSSETTTVATRWTLGLPQLGSESFNLCSFSGVDLYCRDATGKWRWAGTPAFQTIKDQRPEVIIREKLAPQKREWCLYLPLRNRLESLQLGVDADAECELIPPRSVKPLVYYGSSIVHGAYAGRAGLGAPNLLARRFQRPLINLGFSGGARMEPEMAELLSELDAELLVIDPLPNMDTELVRKNTEPFLEIICAQRPQQEILLISDVAPQWNWLYPEKCAEFERKNQLFYQISEKLHLRYPQLRYLDGSELFGTDGEGTTDGIHPNDCGFMRMADFLEAKIRTFYPGLCNC